MQLAHHLWKRTTGSGLLCLITGVGPNDRTNRCDRAFKPTGFAAPLVPPALSEVTLSSSLRPGRSAHGGASEQIDWSVLEILEDTDICQFRSA